MWKRCIKECSCLPFTQWACSAKFCVQVVSVGNCANPSFGPPQITRVFRPQNEFNSIHDKLKKDYRKGLSSWFRGSAYTVFTQLPQFLRALGNPRRQGSYSHVACVCVS